MRTRAIEDDPKPRKLLRRGLSEEGFGVDAAADGEEGSGAPLIHTIRGQGSALR